MIGNELRKIENSEKELVKEKNMSQLPFTWVEFKAFMGNSHGDVQQAGSTETKAQRDAFNCYHYKGVLEPKEWVGAPRNHVK